MDPFTRQAAAVTIFSIIILLMALPLLNPDIGHDDTSLHPMFEHITALNMSVEKKCTADKASSHHLAYLRFIFRRVFTS